jgi:nicotinate-nucleotide adenylyltransferase
LSRERIGVYGGTFDPMHIGHFRIAEALIDAFAFERLLFVPAHVPPHKRGTAISAPYHRYAMLALATQESERMLVSAIELEAPARPYTIETMARLAETHPNADLFFVMGGDSFADIGIWRDYERLLREYRIVVATRPGQSETADLTKHLSEELRGRVIDLRGGRYPAVDDFDTPHIFLTDYVREDVSATTVRSAVAAGNSIEGMVPSAIARYVAKYRLYR